MLIRRVSEQKVTGGAGRIVTGLFDRDIEQQPRLYTRPSKFCVFVLVVVLGLAKYNDHSNKSKRLLERQRKKQQRADCVPRPRAEVERDGLSFVGERPILTERDSWCAVDGVDAGYCVRSGGSVRCLPSFIIAGAQKAATGWLRQRLAPHPLLAQNSGKELHFFDTLGPERSRTAIERAWRGSYLRSFKAFEGKEVRYKYTYEKTPDYMPNMTAMASLFRLLPSVKLVYLLRDPTPRAYSAYQHHCRRSRIGVVPASQNSSKWEWRPIFSLESTPAEWERAKHLKAPCSAQSFDDFILGPAPSKDNVTQGGNVDSRIVSWGLYASQLKKIHAIGFRDAQQMVIFSELALMDTSALLNAVVAWLGLRPFDFKALKTYKDALGREQLVQPGVYGSLRRAYLEHNYAMASKHTNEKMLPRTRDALKEYYRQPNRDLDRLIRFDKPRLTVYPPRSTSAASPTSPSKSNNTTVKYTSILPPSWYH